MSRYLVSCLLIACTSQAFAETHIPIREPWMNWFNANIDGWQTQCSIQTDKNEPPSKCYAIFAFDDGTVSLRYQEGKLKVSVLGKCGFSKYGKTYQLPLAEPLWAIEEVARMQPIDCPPPVLTSNMRAGVGNVNVILSLITEPPE